MDIGTCIGIGSGVLAAIWAIFLVGHLVMVMFTGEDDRFRFWPSMIAGSIVIGLLLGFLSLIL